VTATYRDAIKSAFRTDWNNRRVVLESDSTYDIFTLATWVKINVPMEAAKRVLAEVEREERL
jgi:hypothetical protein